jgi:hypothetical protein
MLFRGTKAKDLASFCKVRLKGAVEFKRSMRDPKADVYAFLVSFVGENRLN